jgi:hypothetical protein
MVSQRISVQRLPLQRPQDHHFQRAGKKITLVSALHTAPIQQTFLVYA